MNEKVKALPRTRITLSISCVALWLLTGCNPSPQTMTTSVPELKPGEEAISFLGDTLVQPELSQAAFRRADSLLTEAYTLYQEDSTDLNAIIWYGRRLAYLNRYREAIDIYTLGLKQHPQSPELLRHRGHRYLTTRQTHLAIQDLQQAAELAEKRDIEIEPDGIPNKLDIPLTNLHFNIYYHLGLAFFIKADFTKAVEAFAKCLTYSDNPDLKVAATYWLYLSRLRSGERDVAGLLLADIHPDMEIIENDAYLRQLLLFKSGDQSATAPGAEEDSLPLASTHYGISCWHDAFGRKGDASAIRKEILSSDGWPLFGYLAAEADSSRLISE